MRTDRDARSELMWQFDAEHEVFRDLDAPGFVRLGVVLAVLFFVAAVLAINLRGSDVGWAPLAGNP